MHSVQIRIAIGRRLFAPSWLMTSLTLALLVLFIGLGRWQWDRGDYKAQLREQFLAGEGPAVALGAEPTTALARFARITVAGRWDGERQFLLDNRTREGRAGYEVLTPLRLADGRWLLVNRGWLPFSGFREQLPEVSLSRAAEAASAVRVSGRIDELPSAGLESGRAAPPQSGTWPRVTSYPKAAELAAALGLPAIEPRVLLLDADAADGYRRDWQPPGMVPEKHWSYAIQWWSFAVVLLLLYTMLNTKKIRNET
jgi:surfeit locus 1 family protein